MVYCRPPNTWHRWSVENHMGGEHSFFYQIILCAGCGARYMSLMRHPTLDDFNAEIDRLQHGAEPLHPFWERVAS